MRHDTSLSYFHRCLQLKLDPLCVRRLKLNLVFLFNLLHSPDLPKHSISILSNRYYSTRNSSMVIYYAKAKSKLRSNFFLIRYARIWNSLPPALRSIECSKSFRRQLDLYFTPDALRNSFAPYVTLERLFEKGPQHI